MKKWDLEMVKRKKWDIKEGKLPTSPSVKNQSFDQQMSPHTDLKKVHSQNSSETPHQRPPITFAFLKQKKKRKDKSVPKKHHMQFTHTPHKEKGERERERERAYLSQERWHKEKGVSQVICGFGINK